MSRDRQKGSITIFLSLASILFLALICAAVESARIQGAKAQTANIMGMGNYSVLGEFERDLFEKYELFSLDGAYGSGSFQIDKVKSRLDEFISYNADPAKDIISVWSFDPWNLEMTESQITSYALLTDEKGEPFYQQAVAFMHSNIAFIALDSLLDETKDIDEIEYWEKAYEDKKDNNDELLDTLEQEKEEKLEQMEQENQVVPVEVEGNPLLEFFKLRRKDILDLVAWDKKISTKKVKNGDLVSKSKLQKGSLKLEKKYGGFTDHTLFREYLFLHFSDFRDQTTEGALDYEMEYILIGKKDDKSNLKSVAKRLLAIREGMNYLYLLTDRASSIKAAGVAASLTGFLGIPALTAATQQAILLGWAFGESLIDVRILMDGGKVPVFKTKTSWTLAAENLGKITQILKNGAKNKGEGLDYQSYLKILMAMGSITNQKMRALDLIQLDMKENGANQGFRADHCIVAIKSNTKWNCKPVFLGLPQAVFGIGSGSLQFEQEGSMAYG